MITTRDDAIDIICSNLLMAGLLTTKDYGNYMSMLNDYDDFMLAESLIASKQLLNMALEIIAYRNKN